MIWKYYESCSSSNEMNGKTWNGVWIEMKWIEKHEIKHAVAVMKWIEILWSMQ